MWVILFVVIVGLSGLMMKEKYDKLYTKKCMV